MTTMTATTKPVTFNGVLGKKPLTTYSDPYPALKGTDKAPVECGMCSDGVYDAPSRIHWNNGRGDTTWCFWCNGSGKRLRSVSKLRSEAKADAYAAEFATEIAAYHDAKAEAFNAAAKAEEFALAWDEAHKEQERRNAIVGGFIGEAGDKVKNLQGTVNFTKMIDGYYGSSMLVIITLDNGQVVKTFGSGSSLYGLDRGQKVTILSATVKGHDHYNGQDQTELKMVKIDDFGSRADRFLATLFHWTYTDAEVTERGYFKKAELPRLAAAKAARMAEFPELEQEVADLIARQS